MAKSLEVKSRFTISDEFSGRFGKMMAAAQSRFDKTKSSIGRMNDFLASQNDNFKKIGAAAGVTGLAVMGGLGYAVKEAIAFEKAMAGVAKYANVDIGTDQFRQLGEQAKELSMVLGISSQQTAELMQNLAGGGVAVSDLKAVTEIAGKMGVAFDVAAETAGESFVQIKNALNISIEETSSLMDAINQLGNTYAANSDQILDFMKLGGAGVASSLKAGGDAVAAFGSRLISMGETSSTAATIMEAFTRTVNKNAEMSKIFEKVGGGAEGMFAVIEHGSKLSGKAQKEYFSKFGNYGLAIQKLASNTDALRETMDLATDTIGRAGSVQAEFDNVQNTSAARLAKLKIAFENIVITIGEALLPMVMSLANKIVPIVNKISTWIKENKTLVKGMAKAAAIFGTVALAVSGLSYGVVLYNKAVLIAKGVTAAWNVVMAMNPIGLIVAAIVLLIGYITIAIKKFESFGSVMLFILGPIGRVVHAFMMLYKYWSHIVDAFKTDGILGGIKKIGAFLVDLVLYPLQQLLNLISKIPGMGNVAGNSRDAINNLRAKIGAIDIGSELKTTNVVKTPPKEVNSVNNKSEVVLKIDDGKSVKTQDITNGSFMFNTIPTATSTMK